MPFDANASWSARASWLASALLLLLPGCESRPDPRHLLSKHDAGLMTERLPAGFKLDLPTAPIVVQRPNVPVQHPDGSYSVFGLLERKSDLLGKGVTVLAHVVELNAPKKPACPPCNPPHLYLADSDRPKDSDPRLLVADFEPRQVKGVRLGGRYQFTGQFQTTSLSRFSRAEGLLSLKSVKAR
jgi:hypothetical protein